MRSTYEVENMALRLLTEVARIVCLTEYSLRDVPATGCRRASCVAQRTRVCCTPGHESGGSSNLLAADDAIENKQSDDRSGYSNARALQERTIAVLCLTWSHP
jgi:hypothetical protein